MRIIFEKFVHKTEIAHTICDTIGLDQFAYEKGLNTFSQVPTYVTEMV